MFTNTWFANVITNYSTLITLIPMILVSAIKFLAILDPKIPSNSLIEWVQSTAYRSVDNCKVNVQVDGKNIGSLVADGIKSTSPVFDSENKPVA